MRTAFVLAVLLIASPASAAVIDTGSKHCGCTLIEVPPELHVTIDTTGGWGAFVGSAEEKAAAQLADLLNEPEPEASSWAWICLPRVLHLDTPRTPTVTGPDWRPLDIVKIPTIETQGQSVPEPSALMLAGMSIVALRRRHRERRR